MEGTHNRKSAYSSTTVAANNKIYVGPAAYSTNAFLVELDSAVIGQAQGLCLTDYSR